MEKKVNQLDAVISTHPAMIQVAVNEQSEKFAPHDSIKAALQAIDKMLVALVEEEKSDIIERDTSQTMSKSITDEIEDEISLEGNVKECNAMIIELDEKFYVKFAQFEQQQKEMDQNTMKTINVRTDQSKRKIVIRTPPEDEAQCFDVACENAMAKMGYTIGLFSPCLYLHKTENATVDVAKSQSGYDTRMSVYGTAIKVFLDARSPSSQKHMQHHVDRTSSTPTRCSSVTRPCRVGVLVPGQRSVSKISVVPAVSLDGSLPSARRNASSSITLTWRCPLATWSGVERSTGSSWNRTAKIQDDQLQTEDQNS